MKINEVEQTVGITKKNIRFYEDAGLLHPTRSSNGYRDYSPEDVETLKQIKLFRKLDLSLDEIRHLLQGSLTLEDSLKRHLIVLERRAKNLETVTTFCKRLLTENTEPGSLDVERLLLEMDHMEKGGTRFVDIKNRDKRVRKRGALIGASLIIAFSMLFMGIVLWGIFADPEFPIPIALILIIPILIIISMLYVLRERFREIEGGEIYEASKY